MSHICQIFFFVTMVVEVCSVSCVRFCSLGYVKLWPESSSHARVEYFAFCDECCVSRLWRCSII